MNNFRFARSHLAVAVLMFVAGLSVPVIIGLTQRNGTENENTVYAVKDGKKIRAKQVLPQIKEELKKLEKNKYIIKKAAVENLLSAEPAVKNNKINWRIPMGFLEPTIKVDNGFLPPLMTSELKKKPNFFRKLSLRNVPGELSKANGAEPDSEGSG